MATKTLPVLTEPRALTSYSIIAGSKPVSACGRYSSETSNSFDGRIKPDIATQLVIAGSHDYRLALVTPPSQRFASWHNTALHARPRLEVIGTLGKMLPTPPAHGGLSPGAMRRVREFVDTHLNCSIDLTTLASVAGVSIHHFARGFKQSAKVTPHHYLVQKRVERAQELLARTELSLSEIAYAVGFLTKAI